MNYKQKQNFAVFRQNIAKVKSLLKSGKWSTLSSAKRAEIRLSILRLYRTLQSSISRRVLLRALGVAVFLLGSSAVKAQNFASPILNPYSIAVNGTGLAKATLQDLDADGDLDLLTYNYDAEQFEYQENIGDEIDPEFDEVQINPFGLSGQLYTPVLCDIDGDGDFDIMGTTVEDGTYSFIENTGTTEAPAFGTPEATPFGLTGIYNIATDYVDIDNDGDLDIFSSRYDEVEEAVLLYFTENIGTATEPEFEDAIANPFGFDAGALAYFSLVSFADIDLDGDLDFLRTEFYGEGINYHENVGTITEPDFDTGTGELNPFGITIPALEDSYLAATTLVDIDADGDMDIFVSEYYGGVYFYENTSINASISEEQKTFELNVYPNPVAGDFIFIEGDFVLETIERINITTIDGKRMDASATLKGTNQLNISNLPDGIYFITLFTDDGRMSQQKFIKQ